MRVVQTTPSNINHDKCEYDNTLVDYEKSIIQQSLFNPKLEKNCPLEVIIEAEVEESGNVSRKISVSD